MNNYKVIGESRQVGAIGVCEPFTEFVTTNSSREAYSQVREQYYANSREHVHIKEIQVSTGDGEYDWFTVESRAYLDI
jgi:hypothetical protein